MKSLRAALDAAEKEHIETALYKFDGNISEAAEALQISRRVLTRKIAEHELGDFAARLREKAGISGPRH